jgi:hypothetical protein
MNRSDLALELNSLFINENQILIEGLLNKIIDILPSVVRRKDQKNLNYIMKKIPKRSMNKLKEDARKKYSDFDDNYQKSLKLIKLKKKAGKRHVAFSVATAASVKGRTPEEILKTTGLSSLTREERKSFGSEIIGLLLALAVLARYVSAASSYGIENLNEFSHVFGAAAIVIALKNLYHLISKRKAGWNLFVF